MITVQKESTFREFHTFICYTTQWMVYKNGTLAVIHTKDRYVYTNKDLRFTEYATWDCKTSRYTMIAKSN